MKSLSVKVRMVMGALLGAFVVAGAVASGYVIGRPDAAFVLAPADVALCGMEGGCQVFTRRRIDSIYAEGIAAGAEGCAKPQAFGPGKVRL